jgi:hypothetical protein
VQQIVGPFLKSSVPLLLLPPPPLDFLWSMAAAAVVATRNE